MTFSLSTASEIQRVLGERLRTQRLAQALSQRDLAQMAGLSLGALRKMERNGQSSLETLIRVVHALGLAEELNSLFILKRESIAQMEQAEAVKQRKRAPRRKAP